MAVIKIEIFITIIFVHLFQEHDGCVEDSEYGSYFIKIEIFITIICVHLFQEHDSSVEDSEYGSYFIKYIYHYHFCTLFQEHDSCVEDSEKEDTVDKVRLLIFLLSPPCRF
tara:strand:- start:591 stop:923 length:333 start_codon:yes stop_codon:yes gene_type:complete